MEDNYFFIIFLLIIVSLIVSIITERLVINRLKLSEGVDIIAGRCRLKKGYGKLDLDSQEKFV